MASTTQVPPPNYPRYYRRRRSLSGPLVLIILGVLFLLITSHVISWPQFGHYFGRFWPLLLILWGGVRLAEYYSDRASGLPSRGIGAGGVMLIIFLIILGMSASNADRVNWQALQGEVDVDDDFNFGGMFGQNFTFNGSQEQALPADAKDLSLRVISDHGDVAVHTWDENKVKVDVAKKIRANAQEDANKADQQTQPTVQIEGSVITVNANTTGAGTRSVRADLEIWVPKTVTADVSTRNGDVNVADRAANVKVSTSRGDVTLDDITGTVAIEQRKGDVKISKIIGDVSVDGRADDTTISDVKGTVKLNGDFLGGINVSKVAKTVTFRSSRTDMELASLDGDLVMDGGDLRASKMSGPMRVVTRSKDIHLDDLSGDLRIENTNGGVEVHSAKLGAIDIQNRKGDVEVVVPEKSVFQVDFKTRNGEISSDFSGINVTSQHDDASASGNVGNGGPKVQVSNEHGNIQLRKAGAVTQQGQ